MTVKQDRLFAPLESPAINGGNNINKALFHYRKGGDKAPSSFFLTGFAYHWVLILSLVLLPGVALHSFAAEIHVPSQFSTIQAAIDASQDNDIIIVQPGTYTENIDYNGKAITLTSTNPLDPTIVASTIIDGNMNGSVVTFDSGETPNSILTGFTIRNGSGTLIDGKRYGGGVFCGGLSFPTIRHNKIIDNSADVGGAIYIHGNSPPTITNGPKADYPYVATGQTVTLSVTATDPDGEDLVYRWVPREGGTITGTGSTVSFLAATAGAYHIDLTIDDQHGGTATGVVTVTFIGVAIQTPVPQLIAGKSASISANVTPAVANSPEYPVSITWSMVEGPATGTFDAAVNGTPGATSITFTPSASGPGRIQAAYKVGTTSTTHSVAIALNSIGLSIEPASGMQDATVQAVIAGNNLGRVNGISLSGSGVTASIREGKREDSLPVQFVIGAEAAPGNRTIILTTPEGQFSTLLTFQIRALPAITANPASLNLTTGDTGKITFSIPDPAPAGGVILSLTSSLQSVATVQSTATIPVGQQSIEVNVNAVGYGTTTITANSTGYSKAQVPVTVINPALITFSPSPLIVPVSVTVQCTVNISNPAPAGGLVITLTGGTGKVEIPATVTIPASQTSATFNVKGLAEGTATITATATGYPAATLQVNIIVYGETPIDCGQIIASSISTAGEKDSYRFIASSGDVVTIRARVTSGSLGVYVQLYGPTGALVGSAYSSPLTQLDRTLTAAGTYTVLVSDANYRYTGNYTLTWQKLNGPCGATVLSCGQVVVGNLGAAGELDSYQLTVADNDVVTVRATRTGSAIPRLELYNSAGTLIVSANYAITRTFTTGGTYTVLLRDDSSSNTGGYAITWNSLVNACSATVLNCGQILSGTIGATVSSPPWSFYTFTASANDVVTIRARATGGGPDCI